MGLFNKKVTYVYLVRLILHGDGRTFKNYNLGVYSTEQKALRHAKRAIKGRPLTTFDIFKYPLDAPSGSKTSIVWYDGERS